MDTAAFCSSGHLEVVKLLLDKGPNVGVATNNGWTPLHAAAQNGHLEVVMLLLDTGAGLVDFCHNPKNSQSPSRSMPKMGAGYTDE